MRQQQNKAIQMLNSILVISIAKDGVLVEQDYKKAQEHFYELAVAQDHAESLNNLGFLYTKG